MKIVRINNNKLKFWGYSQEKKKSINLINAWIIQLYELDITIKENVLL